METKTHYVEEYLITLDKEEFSQLLTLLDMGLELMQDPNKVFDPEPKVVETWKYNLSCMRMMVKKELFK